jgi:zinc protease
MTHFLKAITIASAFAVLSACAGPQGTTGSGGAPSSNLTLDIESYELENGLSVVLHVDRSDPIVAIDIAAHVGSARESKGRTGFAHLFEHLLFLDSENLGYGGLDEMNTRIGGEGTNGFTTNDMTQYFQAVPSDALEKVIWAEADKLGYFINTVTQNVVDNEKQVVKNEKRQRVDNQPYGHNWDIIGKAIYPEDHPYNWQVIGSLEDLDAATLEDTRAFYERWYVPNNVTLSLTGDFDIAEAKLLIEKYFGEIPRGEAVEPYPPRAGSLPESKSLYYVDNFAKLPQLTAVWPTVEQYHPDSYPLEILSEYLSIGKRAPLNEVLVDETKLTSNVTTFSNTSEIAGEFYLIIRGTEGEPLDDLLPAIEDGFDRFEENGISLADLNRIKAGKEVAFYNEIQSVLGKAIQLAEYDLFTGDPHFYKTDLAALQSVTPDDVMRVYNKYIKDKPVLHSSVVPKGQAELALSGAREVVIAEEKIEIGAEADLNFDPTARTFTPTPSSFDRTIEPDFGAPYTLRTPGVWRDTLANGIEVYGIENRETPLVYFSLQIQAGQNRAGAMTPALADITGDMLEKGTTSLNTAEFEDAVKSLGSTINVSASLTETTISGNTLARNFDKTFALIEDMILNPRWDEEEFELLKIKRINQIKVAAADPNSIARREAAALAYDSDHPYHYAGFGPEDKMKAITIQDVKAFHAENYAAGDTVLHLVGAVTKNEVRNAADSLASKWETPVPPAQILSGAKAVETSRLYFYDVPGAKQSVLRLERPSLSAVHPDYVLAQAINFPLGGIYTSKLNTSLRVDKGYTYGIRSGFSGAKDDGTFRITSSVRSNVTKESLELISDIVSRYGPEFTQNDLKVMKEALLRGQALKNETLSDKLSIISQMSEYGYSSDFKNLNAKRIEAMTLEDVKRLTADYMRIDAMNMIVVGDAKTQAGRLSALGYGEPIFLNTNQD